MVPETKVCSKCGANKRMCSNGRFICDQCNRARALAYRIANIDVVREKDRMRVSAIPSDKKREKHKRWRDSNREHVQAKGREVMRGLYKKDPAKFRAKSRAYHANNRTLVLEKFASNRRELSDAYVRTSLRLRKQEAEILHSLIELKREHLRIHRITKQLKKELQNV